jgi:hypothetical protein
MRRSTSGHATPELRADSFVQVQLRGLHAQQASLDPSSETNGRTSGGRAMVGLSYDKIPELSRDFGPGNLRL